LQNAILCGTQSVYRQKFAVVDRGRWVPHKFSFASSLRDKDEKKILRNDCLSDGNQLV